MTRGMDNNMAAITKPANMTWIKNNLLIILLMSLLALCGTVGTIYIQKLARIEAKVVDDHEIRIRSLESTLPEMRQNVANIRTLLDERTANIIKEIERISDHMIERMDQQHEFIKGMINK